MILLAQNDTGNRHPEGMAMPTELKNVLTWSEKIEQYDKIAKNLLARKSILAHILVETVEDFKDMSPKELRTSSRATFMSEPCRWSQAGQMRIFRMDLK